MSFLSVRFLGFFLMVWGLSVVMRPQKNLYKFFLIAINFLFYGFFGLAGVGILVIDAFINFGFLKILEKRRWGRWVLGLAIGFNLILLSGYKYFNNGWDVVGMEIIAPIGISFFSFKIISVLIDTYRQKVKIESLVDFLTYVSFFPQISAGPIARFKEFSEDLNKENEIDRSKFWVLLISGWLKMYLIGGILFDVVNQTIYLPQNFSRMDLVLGMLSLSFYIFANFSGYCDISEALAMVLGFRTPKNFNSPYRSVGFRDFWQRWHMSLSSWLRDYLYIPLGGNRKGKGRKYVNLLTVMTIGGIWHGAGINFLVWGGLHGIMLMITHFLDDFVWPRFVRVAKWVRVTGRGLGWFLTFGLINITWIIFYPKSLGMSIKYFESLIWTGETRTVLWSGGVMGGLILVGILSIWGDKFEEITTKILVRVPAMVRYLILVAIFYLIIILGPNNYVAPAAYFNF